MSPIFSRFFVSLLALVLAACGGSGGNSGGPQITPAGNSPPSITLTFPPSGGLYNSSSMTVSGAYSDEEGDTPTIVVNIGGESLSADVDAAENTWQADIPLPSTGGPLTLSIESLDGVSDEKGSTLSIELAQDQFVENLNEIVVSTISNEAFVTAGSPAAIFRLELETGRLTPFSELEGLRKLMIDNDQARLIALQEVADGTELIRRAVAIDMATAQQAVLSTAALLPGFSHRLDTAYDSMNNRLLEVGGRPSTQVASWSLDDGSRSLLTDTGFSGSTTTSITAIVIQPGDNRAILLSSPPNSLAVVDIDTLERTLLSGGGVGSGDSISLTGKLAVDIHDNRAFLWRDSGGLLDIDLTTGDRALIASTADEDVPTLHSPQGIAVDLNLKRLLLLEGSTGAVIAIDPDTHERSYLFDPGRGSGPKLLRVTDLFPLDAGRELVAADSEAAALVEVEIPSGDRRTLSGDNVGIGPEFGGVIRTITMVGNNSIVIENQNYPAAGQYTLIRSDLSSGNRLLLSSLGVPGFSYLRGPVIDIDQNRLIYMVGSAIIDISGITYLPGGSLIAVDMDTGNETTLSSWIDGIGSGPNFNVTNHIQLSESGNQIEVLGQDGDILVNLDSGDRAATTSDVERRDDVHLEVQYEPTSDRRGIQARNVATGDTLTISR